MTSPGPTYLANCLVQVGNGDVDFNCFLNMYVGRSSARLIDGVIDGVIVCSHHLYFQGTPRGPESGSHCHVVLNELCMGEGVAALTPGQPFPWHPSFLHLEG